MNKLLDPSATPLTKVGVRKLNRIPIAIIAAVGGIFIAIVAYAATNQGVAVQEKEELPKQPEGETPSTSIQLNEILGNHRFGVIPASQEQPKSDDNEEEKESNQQNLSDRVEIRPPKSFAEVERMLGTSPTKTEKNYSIRVKDPVRSREDIELDAKKRRELLEKAMISSSSVGSFGQHNKHTKSHANEATDVESSLNAELNGISSAVADQIRQATDVAKNAQVAAVPERKRYADSSYGKFGNPSGENRWALNARLKEPASRYLLQTGHVIPGTMISGINSAIPGPIVGQVSRNVYDTVTGKHLLIPQGSKLFGKYESKTIYGQKRLLVAWQRVQLPSGKTIDIGAMPGTSNAGYAGFKDKVNNHLLRTFSSAILMSAITGGVAMSQKQGGGGFGRPQVGDAMTEALGQQLGQTSMRLMDKNMNIAPTITIRPGYQFNITVVKDIVLEPISRG